jgi:ABC-type sugar transport system ATPase subunit
VSGAPPLAAEPAAGAPSAARLEGLCKAFPGVQALDDVTFDVRRGEIHALLGENGAGKSTLIKILDGLYRADSGHVFLDGEEVQLHSVRSARKRGITVVPQDVLAVPQLSIGRNILLGLERQLARRGGLSKRELQVVREALERTGASFDPRTRAGAMSVPELRLAQIARALLNPGDVIAFDEPTAVLSEADADHLLGRLERLRDDGKAIIYVTHRLSEVMRIATRVTVLRDGRVVGTFAREGVDKDRIVALMAKPDRRVEAQLDEAPQPHPQGEAPAEQQVVVDVENLTLRPELLGVSLRVPRGTIVGIAGVQGSGHGRLLRTIAGLDAYDSGRVRIAARLIPAGGIRAAYEAGAVLVPADRRRAAIVPLMSVRSNLVLPLRTRARRFGIRLKRAERANARRYIQTFNIRTPSSEALAGGLSGGNQQKVALARAFESEPTAILLEEPTQGIDVNAKAEIRNLILRLAHDDGLAVVIATSEFEELLGLADVIHVMCLGRMVATMSSEEATYALILHHALP